MILNVFHPDRTLAYSVHIAPGATIGVRSYLTRAYYDIGLVKPDFEVLQDGDPSITDLMAKPPKGDQSHDSNQNEIQFAS